MSSRVMPRRLAIRSAALNWSGRSMSHDAGRGCRAVWTRVGAEADPAHRLDAARDADVDGAGRDQAGDQVVGLLAAAALAVDRGGADVLGQAGSQPAVAGDVVGLLAGLRDAAADDLLDIGRRRCRPSPPAAFWAAPSSSVACRPDSHPFRLPIGLRVASTMTGWATAALLRRGRP